MKSLLSIVVYLLGLSTLNVVISLPIDSDETVIVDAIEIDGNDIDTDDIIDLSHVNNMLYGKPDNEAGERLSKWSTDDGTNPEEEGSYFEGDMLIPRNRPRNGMVDISLRWPKNTVPYVISGKFMKLQLETIKRGMNEYHQKTCIRFVPRTTERDYISITNDNSGCWSSVGRIGGKQELNLQSPACLVQDGTFIHEAMHALGFLHEQTRNERDNYVNIHWENIQSGMSRNFDKASPMSTSGYGAAYDFGSVMHYSPNAFSKNGQPTISVKTRNGKNKQNMGQRNGFSASDILKINNMYNC